MVSLKILATEDKSLLTIAVDLVSMLSGVFQKKRAENWDSGGKDMVFDRVDRPTQGSALIPLHIQ